MSFIRKNPPVSGYHIAVLVLAFVLAAGALMAGCTGTGQQNNAPAPVPSPVVTSPGVPGTAGPAPVLTVAAGGSTPPVVQVRGTPDPAFVVDISVPEKIAPGTTLVGDLHNTAHPRIVEVNLLGEIVWQYGVPDTLKAYTNPGFSVVPLQNGNVLVTFPRSGVYEINRTTQQVVWKYADPKASHDAERLTNGNTLIVDGGYGRDTMADAQVVEVTPQGQVVWSWYARDEFNRAPYNTFTGPDWTHTNAASRLANGNTLISLRNFNLVAEVDRNGKVVRTLGEGVMSQQHDPEPLPNGNLLFANPGRLPQAIEIDPAGKVVWSYTVPPDTPFSSASTRDADRLQNGNTLITAANRLIEVTPQGEVVWQFRLKDVQFTNEDDAKARGFYKAIRIPPG
jgi:outer membrane protein assembly factor BamB